MNTIAQAISFVFIINCLRYVSAYLKGMNVDYTYATRIRSNVIYDARRLNTRFCLSRTS